jgi:hypothetical protein
MTKTTVAEAIEFYEQFIDTYGRPKLSTWAAYRDLVRSDAYRMTVQRVARGGKSHLAHMVMKHDLHTAMATPVKKGELDTIPTLLSIAINKVLRP